MSRRFESTGGREAVVDRIPNCDLCGDGTPATHDGKTTMGPWAFMCDAHFGSHGTGLGVGRGQKLYTQDADA